MLLFARPATYNFRRVAEPLGQGDDRTNQGARGSHAR